MLIRWIFLNSWENLTNSLGNGNIYATLFSKKSLLVLFVTINDERNNRTNRDGAFT